MPHRMDTVTVAGGTTPNPGDTAESRIQANSTSGILANNFNGTEHIYADLGSAQTFTGVKTFTTPALGAATGTSVAVTGAVSSSSPSAGVGYATGAGGTVSQLTNRTTGVTINKISGVITTHNASLAAEAAAAFVVTNSSVAIGDVVVVSQQSGAVGAMTDVVVTATTAGTFTIAVMNNNPAAGTAETGAILINFAVIKAVSA